MDITPFFKACIKTIKARNAWDKTEKKPQKSILTVNHNKNPITTQAKAIFKNLNQLVKFINENKKAYLNFRPTERGTMTDMERDQIDSDLNQHFTACLKAINELRGELSHAPSKQIAAHGTGMIEYLEYYLKCTTKSYLDMKAVRTKRALELQKMSKIEKKDKSSSERVVKHLDTAPTIENKLSPEEMQMFESENEQLLEELNIADETVQLIEKEVVHISELQNLFCEKVLEQEKDIERISTVVVTSTENVRDANEQIRQAIQRNAGLRIYILFFLIVMSVSLLFLDWYNE